MNRELFLKKKNGILISIDNMGQYFHVRSKYFRFEICKIDFNSLEKNIHFNLKKIFEFINSKTEQEIKTDFKKESLTSSMIEGSTLNSDNFADRINNSDDIEVIEHNNQIKALEFLKDNNFKKINIHIINFIHQILFSNLNNSSRFKGNIGTLKTEQNYISSGTLPCSPLLVEAEIQKWIIFFNEKPHSIKNAIVRNAFLHGWFEVIHPFSDGNGRIGRLLILFYLKMHGFLINMNLIISDEIRINLNGYYSALENITIQKNYDVFIDWFINIPIKNIYNNINKSLSS